jgi:hypothetical protein
MRSLEFVFERVKPETRSTGGALFKDIWDTGRWDGMAIHQMLTPKVLTPEEEAEGKADGFVNIELSPKFHSLAGLLTRRWNVVSVDTESSFFSEASDSDFGSFRSQNSSTIHSLQTVPKHDHKHLSSASQQHQNSQISLQSISEPDQNQTLSMSAISQMSFQFINTPDLKQTDPNSRDNSVASAESSSTGRHSWRSVFQLRDRLLEMKRRIVRLARRT